MVRALQGIRVVDLTRMLPGPYATMVLADLGADVVKIEDTRGGDPTRWSMRHRSGSSSTFEAVNRWKRSLAVDLKNSEGAAVVRRLIERADVLVEGFRPGVMERLGFGFDAVAAFQPRLVYCSISGYGQDGPLRERGGHDVNYLALAGVLGLQADAEGNPVLSPIQIADLGGSLYGLVAILAALVARAHTGRGQYIDLAMADVGTALLPTAVARLFGGDRVPLGKALPLAGRLACYNVYRTADGRHLSVGALEEKFWAAFCRVIGREDLVARQTDEAAQEEMASAVGEIIRSRTLAEWVSAFAAEDACVEPVLSLDEALDAPQSRHRRRVFDFTDPGGSTSRQLGLPFTLSDTPPSPVAAAPGLGEHTREILGELGYSETSIERLIASGAVAAPRS
jgi:crotonobetainyl-CoA:carnitine CoA-transferase CaiB-like acyl-CoA transferase